MRIARSRDHSVTIPDGSFTAVVGPNACGKSTLLRALSCLLAPADGSVILGGRAIGALSLKEVARRLGLLPQSAVVPEGITVADLVARGRYPHQSILRNGRGRTRPQLSQRCMQLMYPICPAASSTSFRAVSATACRSP